MQFRAVLPVACSTSPATKLPPLWSESVDHHMGEAAVETDRPAGRSVGRCMVPIYFDSCSPHFFSLLTEEEMRCFENLIVFREAYILCTGRGRSHRGGKEGGSGTGNLLCFARFIF